MNKVFNGHMDFPIIIGVCGGSGSGKSEFACNIAQDIGEAIVISTDNFYKDFGHMTDKERREVDFDDPESFDMDEFYKTLKKIKKEKPTEIDIPEYDFINYRRKEEKKKIELKRIIIFEGLFIFSKERTRKLFDYKIFVDSASGERLARRLYRDEKLRGREINDIIEQWRKNVETGFQKHIRFTKGFADIVVNSRFEEPIDNPFLQKPLQIMTGFLKYILSKY